MQGLCPPLLRAPQAIAPASLPPYYHREVGTHLRVPTFFVPMCKLCTSLMGCANLYETVAAESCPLFIQLRYRTPSSPICLSDVIRKPFALSHVFLLSSGGKSVLLVKKKAPSRSGFPLSMHVVLKTRHVNPNIHARRFIVHVRSPNLSATRPQLLSLRGVTTQYRSLHKAI